MDELTTDYVVDEIVARSNGLISGEEVLEYSPNCMEGCGILGAAAQYLIDRGLYVKEEEFRSNLLHYLDKAVIVELRDQHK